MATNEASELVWKIDQISKRCDRAVNKKSPEKHDFTKYEECVVRGRWLIEELAKLELKCERAKGGCDK